jgi:catecholate siderophore receptor
LSHFYLNTHITPDYGVPFVNKRPLNVSKNTFYGFTDDYEDNKVHMTTLSNLHKFSKETQLKSTVRRAFYERDNWAIAPGGYNTTTGVVNRSLKGNGAKEETNTWQNDFTTKFETFGLKHEVLLGSEILQEKQQRWGHTSISTRYPSIAVGSSSAYGLPTSPTNNQRALANNGIYYQYSTASGANQNKWIAQLPNTAESGSILPSAYGSYYGNKDRIPSGGYTGLTYALYGQDMVEIASGVKVMAGVRRDWLKMNYLDSAFEKNGGLSYAESSYRAGLSYQPTQNQHYYLAYNNSFNTTGDLYSFSGSFKPEKSITYELGGKW